MFNLAFSWLNALKLNRGALHSTRVTTLDNSKILPALLNAGKPIFHLFLSIRLEISSWREYSELIALRCIFCSFVACSPPKSGGRKDLSSGEGRCAAGSGGGVSLSVVSPAICDSVSKSSKIPNLSTRLSQNEIFTKKSRKAWRF